MVSDPTDWPTGLPPAVAWSPLAGGWVGTTSRVRLANGGDAVVKRSPYPARIEADGLRALAAAGVPTPRVLGAARRTLVLEYVEADPDWPGLGRTVARLHRHTGDRFGWHQDNRAGRFVQHNAWSEHWPTFFAERRVRAHLDDPTVPAALRQRLHRACDGPLPALLPERPVASLTHGDLWAGNVAGGRFLLDPEVSYADRELDLAYMELSRSFPHELFAAYRAEWPTEPGYPRRRAALQLHHLLLQVRHFGPSRAAAVEAVLDGYGW